MAFNMGQTGPIFLLFCPFHNGKANTIIRQSVDCVAKIRNKNRSKDVSIKVFSYV